MNRLSLTARGTAQYTIMDVEVEKFELCCCIEMQYFSKCHEISLCGSNCDVSGK